MGGSGGLGGGRRRNESVERDIYEGGEEILADGRGKGWKAKVVQDVLAYLKVRDLNINKALTPSQSRLPRRIWRRRCRATLRWRAPCELKLRTALTLPTFLVIYTTTVSSTTLLVIWPSLNSCHVAMKSLMVSVTSLMNSFFSSSCLFTLELDEGFYLNHQEYSSV